MIMSSCPHTTLLLLSQRQWANTGAARRLVTAHFLRRSRALSSQERGAFLSQAVYSSVQHL